MSVQPKLEHGSSPGTIHCAVPRPSVQTLPTPPTSTVDLTASASDNSYDKLMNMVGPIQQTIKEYMTDVQNIRAANESHRAKIQEIVNELPAKEKDHEDKIEEKVQLTVAIAQAQRLVDDMKQASEDLQAKIEQNNELETSRLERVEGLQNTINHLRKQAREDQKIALKRAGKFICRFCGTVHRFQDKDKHEQRCWGRCKRCKHKKLACDCGAGQSFAACAHCKKANRECEKLASRKAEAKDLSVLKEPQ